MSITDTYHYPRVGETGNPNVREINFSHAMPDNQYLQGFEIRGYGIYIIDSYSEEPELRKISNLNTFWRNIGMLQDD